MPSEDPDPTGIHEAEPPLSGLIDVTPITEDETPQGVVGVATVGERLDGHRFSLASQLLWLVAATTVILLGAAIFAPSDHLEAVKSIASVVFGPLITLLGTSFAWYYASRKSD
ncbi:hypothetical protein ACQPXH_24555 [Nocardia sp. CA-135953]|uniref:hypothetical protein n=1 Tax=Nocardia sp. CA-135953 TaxID=3239978 RepID=UPI003D955C59